MRAQSALRVLWRQGFRLFSRANSTKYPHHPCHDNDPKCLFIPKGTCEKAKEVLTYDLPRDKFLEQMEKKKKPKCCVLRSAAKNPCPEIKRPKKPKPIEEPFRSMWEPPCVTDEQPFCKDMLPRFDAIYYHPSDKCRCYQRTWVECPPIKQRLKKVCCLNGIKPPEIRYRIKDPCPDCNIPYESLKLLCQRSELQRDPNCTCKKLFWPCCKPARCNTFCSRARRPSLCTKLRAPYPSFSEVGRRPPKPIRKAECQCWHPVPQCLVMQERLRRNC
ncbi:uncharacterized protein LOC108113462 [Drosophila eugracilis]|uniref:uncharacterized protein LOC108113462 n=1 Tax=Drosophila eugracilis TaxID=29029 RepID=UPI0007E79F67|nr:uncharacterized protein LOC108113462 [Drosophila eugracilis]